MLGRLRARPVGSSVSLRAPSKSWSSCGSLETGRSRTISAWCRRPRSFPQTRTTLAPSYGAIGTALQAGSALQLNPLFAFKSNQTACKEHGSLHGRLLRMQTLVPLRSHSIMGGTALGTAGRHGGATNFGCGFTTRTSRMVGLPSTRGWKHVEGASRHINRAKNSLD